MDETPSAYPFSQVVWKLIVEFLRYHKMLYLTIVTTIWVVALIGAAAFVAWGISASLVLIISFSYDAAWMRLWPLLSIAFVFIGLMIEVHAIRRLRRIVE